MIDMLRNALGTYWWVYVIGVVLVLIAGLAAYWKIKDTMEKQHEADPDSYVRKLERQQNTLVADEVTAKARMEGETDPEKKKTYADQWRRANKKLEQNKAELTRWRTRIDVDTMSKIGTAGGDDEW